jgi:hypothetical protein
VNGQAVIREGEATGARPGRFVRGPGYVPSHAGAAEEDAGAAGEEAVGTGDGEVDPPVNPGSPPR